MFLLMPSISNSPHVKLDNVGTCTLSIPMSEMGRFESQDDLDNFLFSHYSDLFFNDYYEETTMRYEFFMNKIRYEKMKNGIEEENE